MFKKKLFSVVMIFVFTFCVIQPVFAAPLVKTNEVTSVSLPGVFSANVVQSGSSVPNDWSLGQYSVAKNKGAIGLLAHNYLAGAYFYSMYGGQEITVTYSDGTQGTYVVKNILRFKASNPNDFSQAFISNNGSGETLSSMQVFNRAYKNGWLTFQTCISAEGSNSWGLLFVQAAPK